MKIVFSLFLILGLVACDQKSTTDGTKERANAEQEGANKAENENLARKAEIMEKDLANRHAFYSAIEGEYEGTLKVDKEKYSIKFAFARSIPPFSGDRIRQLSEIENDLNNLYFHMQVVQWFPDDGATAVGCRVSNIRPNMDTGVISVSSAECPNLYTILLSEGGDNAFNEQTTKAATVASKIKAHTFKAVPYLIGTVQPSSNAMKYSFTVKKVK